MGRKDRSSCISLYLYQYCYQYWFDAALGVALEVVLVRIRAVVDLVLALPPSCVGLCDCVIV